MGFPYSNSNVNHNHTHTKSDVIPLLSGDVIVFLRSHFKKDNQLTSMRLDLKSFFVGWDCEKLFIKTIRWDNSGKNYSDISFVK